MGSTRQSIPIFKIFQRIPSRFLREMIIREKFLVISLHSKDLIRIAVDVERCNLVQCGHRVE